MLCNARLRRAMSPTTSRGGYKLQNRFTALLGRAQTLNNSVMTNFLTKKDVRLYQEGKHYRIYEKLGAHFTRAGEQDGVHFAVWAPNAEYVAVMGDWNNWSKDTHPMSLFAESGIWTCFYS